jgi:hypothetical protein
MNHNVTADFGTLVEQSKDIACDYFRYAKNHLASQNIRYSASDAIALAQIMAYDLRTTSILISAQKIESAIEMLSGSVDGLSHAIRDSKND